MRKLAGQEYSLDQSEAIIASMRKVGKVKFSPDACSVAIESPRNYSVYFNGRYIGEYNYGRLHIDILPKKGKLIDAINQALDHKPS